MSSILSMCWLMLFGSLLLLVLLFCSRYQAGTGGGVLRSVKYGTFIVDSHVGWYSHFLFLYFLRPEGRSHYHFYTTITLPLLFLAGWVGIGLVELIRY